MRSRLRKTVQLLSGLLLVMIIMLTSQPFVYADQYSGEILNNGQYGITIDISQSPYNDAWAADNMYASDGCTWFAESRVEQLTGIDEGGIIWGCGQWYDFHWQAWESWGFSRGQYLRLDCKSLICWSNHIAVIEGRDTQGNIIVSEGGVKYYPNNSYCCIRPFANEYELKNKDPGFLGYVYLPVAALNPTSLVITNAIITNRTDEGYDVTASVSGGGEVQSIGFYAFAGNDVDSAYKQYIQPINGKATCHVSFSKLNNPNNEQYYTNVEAFDAFGNASQIIQAVEVVEDLGNDFYATIKQDSSGGYLQCSGSKIVTGLLPESASDTKNAVWHFRKQLDGDYIGSYEISSEGNGGCIDIESYGVADGNGINLLEGVGNLAQRFYICRDRQKGYDRYFFNSVLAMSSLDVPGEYTDLGGTIQLWTTNYTDAQMFLIQSPDWTIEYDANGGAGAPASQTKHYRTPVSIPTTVPSRAYYSFLGWAERATASVAAYTPGDTYSQEGNKTLYAVWERIEADILELPADLEVIGDGAFLQTDADIIVVPESVTQIGDNAFGDVVIYGYEGSAAESYAHSNGLTFVPLDDDS